MRLRYIFAPILACVLSSCVTGERVTALQPGMTKAQVVKTMGKPDGYTTENDAEILTYTNKLISGWSWDKADYYAILKGGKLTSWGTGTVRQNQPPIQQVIVTGAVKTF